MSTLPHVPSTATTASLRLTLFDPSPGAGPEGAWWPRSRRLTEEAGVLVDQFPSAAGRINRMLFSRPDWDDGMIDTGGLRRIYAARGPVKVGSFPNDDTHLMVLSMADGRRVRLRVIPSETDDETAQRLLTGA